MKMTFRSCVVLACIASFTVLGGRMALAVDTPSVTSPTMHGHHGHHRGNPFKRLAYKLDFSSAQKAALATLLVNNKTVNKPLFISLITAKNGLKTLVQSGTATAEAINAQAALSATAETNLDVQRAKEFTQFIALLTPAQATQYAAIQAAEAARFQKFLTRITAVAPE